MTTTALQTLIDAGLSTYRAGVYDYEHDVCAPPADAAECSDYLAGWFDAVEASIEAKIAAEAKADRLAAMLRAMMDVDDYTAAVEVAALVDARADTEFWARGQW